MRKLFVAVDMEGTAGVASRLSLSPDHWEWRTAREWMTDEALAVANTALEMGFDHVIITDSHGNAHNLMPDRMPKGVTLVRSYPRPLIQMQGIDDPGIEGCCFVGFHNGAQSPGGICSHTMYGVAFRDIRLNGVSCSEGYLDAAFAGELGIPVMLVTGDTQTIEDAKRYAPNAELYAVKNATGVFSMSGPNPHEACKGIADSTRRALTERKATPFVLKGPFQLEIEMTSRNAAEVASYLPYIKQLGPYTFGGEFPDMRTVMKFISFLLFYSPVGACDLLR